jgi:hypothetical protein
MNGDRVDQQDDNRARDGLHGVDGLEVEIAEQSIDGSEIRYEKRGLVIIDGPPYSDRVVRYVSQALSRFEGENKKQADHKGAEKNAEQDFPISFDKAEYVNAP